MSHVNKVRIKRVVYEPPDNALISPFLGISLNDLAQETGLDRAYLSRVRSGKTPITNERYIQLCASWGKIQLTKNGYFNGNSYN